MLERERAEQRNRAKREKATFRIDLHLRRSREFASDSFLPSFSRSPTALGPLRSRFSRRSSRHFSSDLSPEPSVFSVSGYCPFWRLILLLILQFVEFWAQGILYRSSVESRFWGGDVLSIPLFGFVLQSLHLQLY